MMTDGDLGQAVIKQLAEVDVVGVGYRPMTPAFALVEDYDAEQVDTLDRLSRIAYAALLGALARKEVCGRGPVVFANAVSKALGVLLTETGWTDEGSENRIEVKRNAGQ